MPRNSVAYDDDFFAWTQEQAQLVRSGQLSALDVENLAEELESMGRSARRELRNRLAVLLLHLLKWQYQPGFRSRSWTLTIRGQRRDVQELLTESPSLRSSIVDDLAHIYDLATAKAAAETGLAEAAFPAECPFTPEQLLSEEFLPED